MLLSVELCSLTVQRDDTSIANLVASGLFGDGAAAVVMVGGDRARPSSDAGRRPPRVLATRSRLYPDTERAMGWDVGATGLRIVLGVEVPDLVRANLRDDVDGFLADHGLTRDDIGWWVAHPGGPKVLEAMARRARGGARRARRDVGLARPDRQPLVGLGPARPRRHAARPPAARPARYGVAAGHGSGLLPRDGAAPGAGD